MADSTTPYRRVPVDVSRTEVSATQKLVLSAIARYTRVHPGSGITQGVARPVVREYTGDLMRRGRQSPSQIAAAVLGELGQSAENVVDFYTDPDKGPVYFSKAGFYDAMQAVRTEIHNIRDDVPQE